MRFLKFTLIILSTPFLFAQSFNKVYVSSGTEFFKDVFKTNVGYDAFGMTNSGRSAGNYDLLFTKLDSCGEVINAYAYGDLKSENLIGVVKKTSGNYVVVCQSLSYTSESRSYEQDVLALEIDINGNIVQQKIIERSNNSRRSRERPKYLIPCSSGGYLISGHDEGNSSLSDDPSILKLDNNLTPVWYKSFSMYGENYGYGITELSSGRIMTVYVEDKSRNIIAMKHSNNGSVLKRMKFTNASLKLLNLPSSACLYEESYFFTQASTVPPSYIILKVDSNANLVWAKDYKATGGLTLNSVKEINGALYVSGYTRNNSESLILKLDTSGAVVWAKNIGNNKASALYNFDTDNKGNLLAVGSVSNSISGNDALIFLSDTSSSLLDCESAVSIQVSNFPLTGSVLNNPSEVNVFKSWTPSVTKRTLSLVDTNLCPWQQRDTIICNGDSVLIDGVYYKKAGVYPDHMTSSRGCDSIILRNLIVSNTQVANVFLGNDTSICNGASLVLRNRIASNRDKLWLDGSSADTLLVQGAGEYWLMEKNSCGEARDTIQVSLKSDPIVVLGNDTAICNGDRVVLRNRVSSTLDKLWQDGSSADTLLVQGAGEYWLMEKSSCGEARDTIQVSLKSDPIVVLGNDTSICNGDQLILRNRVSTTLDKLWQDGSDLDTFIAQGGRYWLTEQNECGTTSDTIDVGISLRPFIILRTDTAICKGQTITLKAETDGVRILWNDQSTSFTLDVDEEGVYWASSKFFTSECESIDSVRVTYKVCKDFEIHMPNVFTPNGDSLNDYFRPIVYEKVGDAVLTIYNRWGEKLFETVNVEKGWDGQYRDKQVPDGVYMWLLEYRDPRNNDSQKEFMSGTVTIIR